MYEIKQEYDDDEESRWSHLLPELLSQISSRAFQVGVVDVIPSVCKSWNNLIDIKYTTTLIRKFLPDPPLTPLANEYRCLMTLRGSSCKFYHPNHIFTMDFPELSGSYIQFSKLGWLLLCSICSSDDSYTYFEKIDLPTCDKVFFGMSFSSPPTSPHCFVIGITRNNAFGIIVRGEEKWSFYESFNIVGQFKPYSHLTICGDCCYAIGHRSKILVFDLKHKSTKFIGNPLYKDNSSVGFEAQFLVKDGTKLLSVMVPWEEQNILIEKITPLKREWSSVETLNNKMLFVSDTSSMLKLAPLKARSNKIYFPKIYNNDTFVPYCLATRKYISLFGESDYSKKSPWNSTAKIKQWSNCTWIETKPFAFACNQQTDW